MVVLLGAIAWLVVRQVVTPVRMAAGISERLAAGRLQERMKVTGEDDIARLGESFNKMAQNLQVKIQQLEELSRMQRRFVSDVSHELRTPLTTVRMAADVIYEAREDFDPIDRALRRTAAEPAGPLRVAALRPAGDQPLRRGRGRPGRRAIDLRDVVHRVVDAAEPLADAQGQPDRDRRGDEQPVVAEADARRVERVLRNLVVNAVEHGEGRDVVVRLAAAGGAVAVAVRDYGVGLKPGEATRVFNRFWRADPARARTTGGTGLGLSIARGGRAAARRLAPGVGRARGRFAVPAHAAARGGRSCCAVHRSRWSPRTPGATGFRPTAGRRRPSAERRLAVAPAQPGPRCRPPDAPPHRPPPTRRRCRATGRGSCGAPRSRTHGTASTASTASERHRT